MDSPAVVTTPVPLAPLSRGAPLSDIIQLTPGRVEPALSASALSPSSVLQWILDHKMIVGAGIVIVVVASAVAYYAWRTYQSRKQKQAAMTAAKAMVDDIEKQSAAEEDDNHPMLPEPTPLPEYEEPVQIDHNSEATSTFIHGNYQSKQGLRLRVSRLDSSNSQMHVQLLSPSNKVLADISLHKKWKTLPVFVTQENERPMASIKQVSSNCLEMDSELFKGQTVEFNRVQK